MNGAAVGEARTRLTGEVLRVLVVGVERVDDGLSAAVDQHLVAYISEMVA